MTTGNNLDAKLRHAFRDTPSRQDLRPSVLRSEFFFDYSINQILTDPRQAWFDLAHTRGVGGKSVRAVVAAVAQELERSFAAEWPEALDLAGTPDGASGTLGWPMDNLLRFIEIWQPDQAAIPLDKTG